MKKGREKVINPRALICMNLFFGGENFVKFNVQTSSGRGSDEGSECKGEGLSAERFNRIEV